MTDADRERRVNPRSLENLKLGAEARKQGKVRRNTTLLPETIKWLEEQGGNVSEGIEQLVASTKSNHAHSSISGQTEQKHASDYAHDLRSKAELDRLRDQLEDQATKAGEWYERAKEAQKERDELVELNHALTTELDRLKEATSVETSLQLPDLEAVRDRVLSSLRVGKQAPEYKRAKAAIDRFIAELRVAVGSTNNSAGATAEPVAVTPPASDRTILTWDAKVNSFLGEVSRRVQP